MRILMISKLMRYTKLGEMLFEASQYDSFHFRDHQRYRNGEQYEKRGSVVVIEAKTHRCM